MQRAHRARIQLVYQQHSELVHHHTCSDLSRSVPDYVPEAVPCSDLSRSVPDYVPEAVPEAALEVLGSEVSISNPGSLIVHRVKGPTIGPGAHRRIGPGADRRVIGPASAVYQGKIGISQIKRDAVHHGIGWISIHRRPAVRTEAEAEPLAPDPRVGAILGGPARCSMIGTGSTSASASARRPDPSSSRRHRGRPEARVAAAAPARAGLRRLRLRAALPGRAGLVRKNRSPNRGAGPAASPKQRSATRISAS